MCENEMWLPVVGYDFYEVSDQGRVRSLDKVVATKGGGTRIAKGRILKQSSQGRYLVVGLHRDGVMKTRSVHRLVLEAFVGPCPPGCQGLHWDDDPANNRLSNLRWGTVSENTQDCIRNGRHPKFGITHCARGGHEYTPENTYRIPSTGHRMCRTCLEERAAANRKGRPTHCPQNHPYDEINTYMHRGRRICRACTRARNREWYHKTRNKN